MKVNNANKTVNKSATKDWRDIRIINVAAFSFAIVSWFATAQGLEKYVFDSIWQPALISFGIQGILFVFNLKLPKRFHDLVKVTAKGKKKKRWIVRIILGIFYIIVLISSSIFSFVYICDEVVYQHQSGYVDDNAMLSSLYNRLLQQTEDYIEEETKALQILASVQLSDLLAENPQILGEQVTGNFRTEEVIDDEIEQKETELALKKQEEEIAHESYINAQKDFDALYGERFWRPDEFEIIKKNRDKKLIEWKNVQDEVLVLEAEIKKLQKEKAGISNSPAKKSVEFLTIFLETDPSPDKLQKCINELQSMVIDMKDGSVIPDNLGQIVRKIRALSLTIEDYTVLRGDEETSSAKTTLASLKEAYTEEIIAPDPKSENFETEKKNWRTNWMGKYIGLQALIRSLPRYHEYEAAQNLSGDYIDMAILQEFNPDKMDDEINDMVRKNCPTLMLLRGPGICYQANTILLLFFRRV